MRALRFTRYGSPADVLEIVDVTEPELNGGDALVSIRAASVTPSDLKTVSGYVPGTSLPRVPGRDFAGVVVGGPHDWIGAEVWGTGGDLGYTRDGSHAELVVVPVSALIRKPERLTFAEASVLGVNFVVGWLGVVETALLEKGETIAIFGVNGGVGSAVAQIARVRGARVIGIDRKPPVDEAALDDFVLLHGDVAPEVRRLTRGAGAEVVYDAVGGVTTSSALACLAHQGRLVVIASTGTRKVEIDLPDFYHREVRMLGLDTRRLGAVRCAELLGQITSHLESGEFRPPPIAFTFGLELAGDAYEAVAKRPPGRVVICP
ncbi:zinc-binding alcohol dehydrogenase family protein [Herbidospora galbida]|uniref:Zinc-binding alcohol dehydrogenase family protein n=1 Tax=Herbidospora galbida TaxID=2575442 RepID=A0A4U3M5I6_9ACTN|nr:zinc-binding alcohol dehydrogenase family protein [Herbidospora galbida]TKK84138.1 zinc-binding alcohol dehydrogenase family protein [Herbidospora galbida]